MAIESKNRVICPHCGHQHEDAWDYEPGEVECAGCWHPFWLTIETSQLFITETMEDRAALAAGKGEA